MKKGKHPPRRKWRRILVGFSVLVVLVVLLVAGSLAYLRFGNLSRHRELCETLMSDYLGRELVISGTFQPVVARTMTLVAGDITLGNADWGESGAMVQIEHLAFSMDLFSLMSGPIVIHEIELRGIRVNLESDAEGRGNWELDLPGSEEPAAPTTGPVLFLDEAVIEDLALFYQGAPGALPLEMIGEYIAIRAAKDEPLGIEFRGSLDRVPVSLAGNAGSLGALLNGTNMQADLAGDLGSARWKLRGDLKDLALLSGMNLGITLEGQDLKAVTDAFHLEEVGEGPFRVEAAVVSLPEGYAVKLAADASDITIHIDGEIDALQDPRALRATIEASAPNLAGLGALAGFEGLPAEPVEASGRVLWEGGSVTFEELRGESGPNLIELDGVLGELPMMLGTDFKVSARGPDLGVFSSLAGIELPAGEYRVEGRVLRVDSGVDIEAMKITMGRADLEIEGFIGDLPDHAGTDVSVEASGPDLSAFQGLAGTALPAEPFEVTGNLQHRAVGVALDGVEARLGDTRVRATGTLVFEGDLVGTQLHLEGEGTDLAGVGLLAGQPGWPEGSFSVEGGIDVRPDGYALEGVEVTLSGVALRVEGLVGGLPEMHGSDLRVDVGGQNLAALSSLAGIDLPAGIFHAGGRILRMRDGIQMESVKLTLGEAFLEMEGVVGEPPGYAASIIRFKAAGPDLSYFEGLAGTPLPPRSFEVGGSLQYDAPGMALNGVFAGLDDTRLSADGNLVLTENLVGTEMQVKVEGPDLAAIVLLMEESGFDQLPALPEGPFSVGGRMGVDHDGYLLQEVVMAMDQGTVQLNGHIGGNGEVGHDLVVSARGPDLSRAGAFMELNFPAKPFDLSSRFMGTPDEFSLTDLAAEVGESDLAGSLSVDFKTGIDLAGSFSSRKLDFSDLLAAAAEDESAEQEIDDGETGPEENEVLFISDKPFELEFLHAMNANIDFEVDQLVIPPIDASQVRVGLNLQDGALIVDPLEGGTRHGGAVTGRFEIQPDGAIYRTSSHLRVAEFMVDLTAEEDAPEMWPQLDLEMQFQGEGGTPHGLAASLSGSGTLVIGAGRMDSSQMDILSADILLQLFAMLNPFAKDDPVTQLDCIVLAGSAVNGDLGVDPIVMATDKMVILGEAKVDFATERISADWVTKPRKGIGISASALTNALISLGGTLSQPRIQTKGVKGAARGSMSVLTLGIADRISAERNVCKKARKMIAGKP